MKRVVTYLIVIASLIGFKGWSQKPGDMEPLSGKYTFESKRELRKEHKVRANAKSYSVNLVKTGPKESAQRFVTGKSGKRDRTAHHRKGIFRRKGELRRN
jgi:hypothetical protein